MGDGPQLMVVLATGQSACDTGVELAVYDCLLMLIIRGNQAYTAAPPQTAVSGRVVPCLALVSVVLPHVVLSCLTAVLHSWTSPNCWILCLVARWSLLTRCSSFRQYLKPLSEDLGTLCRVITQRLLH